MINFLLILYIIINNIYVIFKLLGFPIDFRQGTLGTSGEV